MRARLTAVATLAALTLSAPPALAQTPLPTPTPTPPPAATPAPTPTPTPTPSPEDLRDERDRNSKSVKRIYRDFESDGRIDDCDHTEKALKKARRSIEAYYAEEYPDFRDALTAALQRHRDGKCVEATPTPTPTATPAPGGTGTTPAPPPAATPAPAPAPAPTSPPESGDLPDFGSGSGGGRRTAGPRAARTAGRSSRRARATSRRASSPTPDPDADAAGAPAQARRHARGHGAEPVRPGHRCSRSRCSGC